MRNKCWLAVALAVGLTLAGCATTGGGANEKVALSSSASAAAKTAITAAETANTAAKTAGFEWFWKDKAASDHLQDAIKAANSGDDKTALKLAQQVEQAGIQGQAQAEVAKTAGPRFAKASAPAQAAAKPVKAEKKSAKAESKADSKQAKAEPKAADTATAAKPSGNGSKVYKSTCASCHDAGIAGSPKLGDKAAWGSRIAAGGLYANALNGKGAMPAKGGNASLSEADVKAAVDYMAAQGK